MPYKAEYIWIDGTEPTAKLRSKTKIVADGAELPIWGFDGSSTNQAPGDKSDCVLQPVFSCPDPIRGGDNVLVLCEVLYIDMTPAPTNTRAAAREVAEKYKDQEPLFGIEQEYTFFKDGRPYGFPQRRLPRPRRAATTAASAPTRCSAVTSSRPTWTPASTAGLHLSGINAEVMPGQWEFQVGPVGPPQVADELWARPLAALPHRRGLRRGRHARPQAGQGRLERRRRPHQLLDQGHARELRRDHRRRARRSASADEHIAGYGAGIEDRLTGLHETAPYNEFSYGVSDRGASVRIPWQVEVDKKGYIEDRRPNANCDPYVVTLIIVDTCCSARSAARRPQPEATWPAREPGRAGDRRGRPPEAPPLARVGPQAPHERAGIGRRRTTDGRERPWRSARPTRCSTDRRRGGRGRRPPVLRPAGPDAALLDAGRAS